MEEVPVHLPAARDPAMRSHVEFVAAANKVRAKLLELHAMRVDAT